MASLNPLVDQHREHLFLKKENLDRHEPGEHCFMKHLLQSHTCECVSYNGSLEFEGIHVQSLS